MSTKSKWYPEKSSAREGDPSSRIVIVGEAPSYMEVKLGRPFVGPAGEILNSCLHAAGIARGQCYILNTWPMQVKKERAGNGERVVFEGDVLWQTGKGMTEAGWKHADLCRDLLKESDANVIVPLGQIATDLICGKPKGMMKWRGSILPARTEGPRKAVPSVHPAAIVRGAYLWRYLLINDLQRAKEESESPDIPEEGITYILEPGLDRIADYVRRCREAGIVATDIEVINHQVSCFCLCYRTDEVMVVPLVSPRGGPYWSESDEAEIWRLYGSLMSDPSVEKVNQNLVGFDAPFLLYQNNIHTRGPLCDTMIAQHIMYPEFPKGLDFITSIHTRIPYYKDEGKMWRAPSDWDMFWRYNGKDGVAALTAWHSLEQEMTEQDFWHTYQMTVDMAEPLFYMSTRGLAIDSEALEEAKARIEDEIWEAEAELAAVAEWDFNVNSPKQVKEYFYDTKGCTPYKNSAGNISVDDKVMSRIYRKYNLPEAKLVQRIRALKKLKGTYLDVQADADGRIRCSWNPRGTWTGRLSSSKTVRGTGLNLQNLHPSFKGFIKADEDTDAD